MNTKMRLLYILPAGILLILAFGCRKNLQDKLLTGVDLNYDVSSYLSHQVVVQIDNANIDSKNMPNAVVTVEGEGADQVYDINGSRNISVQDGFAYLAVSPGREIDPAKPVSFTIVADANGYLPYRKTVTISDVDSVNSYTLPMLEKNALPAGISMDYSPIQLDLGNVSAPSTQTVKDNTYIVSNNQTFSLMIPSNIKMYDAQNKLVTGVVNSTMVNYNSTQDLVAAALPMNNKSHENILMKGTTVSTENTYTPISEILIDMRTSIQQVSTLSGAATGSLQLDLKTYNLANSTTLKAGDNVDIYSYSDATDKWNYESTSVISLNNNKFICNFPIKKPCTYSVVPKCKPNEYKLALTFKRPSNVITDHYVEIREGTSQTGQLINAYEEVTVQNNGIFTIPNRLPKNKNFSVWVYEYDYFNVKGRVVGSKLNITGSTSKIDVTVDPQAVSGNPIMKFDLVTKCSNSPSVSYKHSGKCSYRLAANTTDRFLSEGYACDGKLETDRLGWEKYYQFQSTISLKPKNSNNILTKVYKRYRTSWKNFPIYTVDQAWGRFTPVAGKNNTWQFSRGYWYAPNDACADYGY